MAYNFCLIRGWEVVNHIEEGWRDSEKCKCSVGFDAGSATVWAESRDRSSCSAFWGLVVMGVVYTPPAVLDTIGSVYASGVVAQESARASACVRGRGWWWVRWFWQ